MVQKSGRMTRGMGSPRTGPTGSDDPLKPVFRGFERSERCERSHPSGSGDGDRIPPLPWDRRAPSDSGGCDWRRREAPPVITCSQVPRTPPLIPLGPLVTPVIRALEPRGWVTDGPRAALPWPSTSPVAPPGPGRESPRGAPPSDHLLLSGSGVTSRTSHTSRKACFQGSRGERSGETWAVRWWPRVSATGGGPGEAARRGRGGPVR